MAAAWIIIGVVLSAWAFWRSTSAGARLRHRRRKADRGPLAEVAAAAATGMPAQPFDPREPAMSVLVEPLPAQEPGAASRLSGPARQWRLGTVFGLGMGLVVCGLLLLIFPDGAQPAANTGASIRTPDARSMPVPGPTRGTGRPGPGSAPTVQPTAPIPAPAQARAERVTVVIPPGEVPGTVGAILKAEGLITDDRAFINRLVERKLDTRIRSGRFELRVGMSMDAIIDVLTGAGG